MSNQIPCKPQPNWLTIGLLAIVLPPLVLASQWRLQVGQVNIASLAISSNDDIFASVWARRQGPYEVHRWSPDLSETELVCRVRNPISDLTSNADGSQLGLLTRDSLLGYDVAEQKIKWRAATQLGMYLRRRVVMLIDDDRYFFAVGSHTFDSTKQCLLVRASDGEVASRFEEPNGVVRMYGRPGEWFYVTGIGTIVRLTRKGVPVDHDSLAAQEVPVASEHLFGDEWDRLDVYGALLDGSGRDITKRLSDGNLVRARRDGWQSRSVIRVVSRENNAMVHETRLTPPRWLVELARFGMAALAVLSVTILIRDGKRSRYWWRVATDLLVLVLLMLGMTVDLTDLNTMGLLTGREAWLFVVAGLTALCLYFIAPLIPGRAVYPWGVSLVACAVPLLVPVTAFSLILRRFGFRLRWLREDASVVGPAGDPEGTGREGDKPDGPESRTPRPESRDSESAGRRARPAGGGVFRFGIQELLLGTAGAAIFIALGTQSVMFIGIGIPLVFLIALSLVVMMSPSIAIFAVLFGMFIVGISGDATGLGLLCVCPMVLGFLRCYDWVIRDDARASERALDQAHVRRGAPQVLPLEQGV